MEKIILIPDSFKGTMSSQTICRLLSEQAHRFLPGCTVMSVPVADGGEGSVDAFLTALGGERCAVSVTGPKGGPMDAFFGLIHEGRTAVIEMAACAGLPLMGEALDPLGATTYGVGELMQAALDRSVERILLGLGGSATNDGGCGMAAALGVRFLDADGRAFVPTGGTLARIAQIDASGLDPRLASVAITVMCDIDNPLCGLQGAAAVFGPQKGATPEQVTLLDDGLRHLADLIDPAAALRPGAGAAGGMGFGCLAFLKAQLQMGIDAVLDTVDFDAMLADADLVITGEGKLDTQSLRGKVVIGVARRAQVQQVPVVAVVGDVGDGIEAAYDEGVSAVFPINRKAIPFSEARVRAQADLSSTAGDLFRLLAAFRTKKS